MSRSSSTAAGLWALVLGGVVAGCGEEAAAVAPPERLFTLAVLADPHITTDEDRADRLAAAVAWVNEGLQREQIELCVVLGDIGWDGALPASKSLLDALQVPYVPVLGDNEIVFDSEAAFDETYAPQYEALAAELTGWRRAPTPVEHPSTGADAWLQNAAFEHRGVHVLMLDWNVRGQEGILSEFADVHDFAGGTLPFLQAELASVEATAHGESVLMLSHVPMMLGAFDTVEWAALGAVVRPRANLVAANLAGHLHGNLTREGDDFDVHVTDATWDDEVTVRLVRVWRDGKRMSYEHELVTVPFASR